MCYFPPKLRHTRVTRARVIARIARGEIEFLFGQFKMATKFSSFDLGYFLTGYFTGIKPPAAKTKNVKDVQGKLQKTPTHHTTLIKRRQNRIMAPDHIQCTPGSATRRIIYLVPVFTPDELTLLAGVLILSFVFPSLITRQTNVAGFPKFIPDRLCSPLV